jgi:hypothetical protein
LGRAYRNTPQRKTCARAPEASRPAQIMLHLVQWVAHLVRQCYPTCDLRSVRRIRPGVVSLSTRVLCIAYENRLYQSWRRRYVGGPSRTGRTSTVLVRAKGMRAAMLMASARSATSMSM